MPLGEFPGLQAPDWWLDSGPPAFGAALLIDAATEKAAFVGRIHVPGGGSKNIDEVGFRLGAITKGATTALRVSLQNVDEATGFPDETVDESYVVTTAEIVANTWVSRILDATRTINPGALIAVVFQFETFNAGDSIVISSLPGQLLNQVNYCALKSGAGPSWAVITAAASNRPNVLFGFDAGPEVWGTLLGSDVWSDFGSEVIAGSGGGAKEVGTRLITQMPAVIEGAWAFVDMDGNLDLVVYELDPAGSTETVKTSISLDKDVRGAANARLLWVPFPAQVRVKPGWWYVLGLKPTTATSLTVYYGSLSSIAYQAALAGGDRLTYLSRTTPGSGAWSTSGDARRLFAGFRLRGDSYPVRSAGMRG